MSWLPKIFGPLGQKILLEISTVQTVDIAFSYRFTYRSSRSLCLDFFSAKETCKDGKPYAKRKPLMLHCFVSLFSLTSYKKIFIAAAGRKCYSFNTQFCVFIGGCMPLLYTM